MSAIKITGEKRLVIVSGRDDLLDKVSQQPGGFVAL